MPTRFWCSPKTAIFSFIAARSSVETMAFRMSIGTTDAFIASSELHASGEFSTCHSTPFFQLCVAAFMRLNSSVMPLVRKAVRRTSGLGQAGQIRALEARLQRAGYLVSQRLARLSVYGSRLAAPEPRDISTAGPGLLPEI